jgi:DNA polymerase III psi subunit
VKSREFLVKSRKGLVNNTRIVAIDQRQTIQLQNLTVELLCNGFSVPDEIVWAVTFDRLNVLTQSRFEEWVCGADKSVDARCECRRVVTDLDYRLPHGFLIKA